MAKRLNVKRSRGLRAIQPVDCLSASSLQSSSLFAQSCKKYVLNSIFYRSNGKQIIKFPFPESFDEKLLLCIGDIAVMFSRVEFMSLHMLFQ